MSGSAAGGAAAGPEEGSGGVSLAGTWLGLDAPQNPDDARLLGCSEDLGALERQLAVPAGHDCVALVVPPVAIQAGPEITLLPHRVACGDGQERTRSGSVRLDGATVHGQLDVSGSSDSTEVRSTFFSGSVAGGRLDLAVDRLEVRGLSSGACLVSPPLLFEVQVVP